VLCVKSALGYALARSEITTPPGAASSLQPRRKVGSLTDHRPLPCLFLAHDFADDDQPRCNAHACGERFTSCGLERRDCGCELHGRSDSAFGLVLVRLGPTKICKHTVPEELGDVPLKTRDLTGHGILIFSDEFTEVLGVKP
jgi:hypothetical protein